MARNIMETDGEFPHRFHLPAKIALYGFITGYLLETVAQIS